MTQEQSEQLVMALGDALYSGEFWYEGNQLPKEHKEYVKKRLFNMRRPLYLLLFGVGIYISLLWVIYPSPYNSIEFDLTMGGGYMFCGWLTYYNCLKRSKFIDNDEFLWVYGEITGLNPKLASRYSSSRVIVDNTYDAHVYGFIYCYHIGEKAYVLKFPYGFFSGFIIKPTIAIKHK